MIPILYEKTETAFTSQGLGRLGDCPRCLVTEERNGVYECEFDYPVTGVRFEDIEIGRIVAVTHDESGDIQPFDIYRKTEPIDGVVTFYAQHISYRMNGITVKPFTASSCADAFLKIPTNSIGDNPFSFWTDKAVSSDMEVEEPRALRSLLAGSEGSILDVYGTGEYEFDKFDVKLYLYRGTDTDVSIRYGKNLVDLENDVDAGDVYTAVVPFWAGDNDGTIVLVTLPEWYISSGYLSPGGREVIIPMDLSDAFEDQPTTSQLREKATSRLANSSAWLPDQNIKVDFVQLWQTEEYKQFAPLQRLKLCDTCEIVVSMYDLDFRAKIIRTVWNVLTDRYDEMELGDKPATYADVLVKPVEEAVAKAIGDTKTVIEAALANGIADAMEQIRGGMGGYIVQTVNAAGQPIELLVTDNLDLTQAVNIWRWNLGGLAHSSNGYNGPYDVAITQDGKINASMILTGVLSANLIRAGIISDTGGNNSWNLDTGVFKTTDANGWIQIKDGIVGFYNNNNTRFASLVHAYYDNLQTIDSLSIKSVSVLDLVGDVAVQIAGNEITTILENGGGGSDEPVTRAYWDSDGSCFDTLANKTKISGHVDIPDGVHGPTINSVQPGCIMPVPFLTFTDVGVPEGSTEAAVRTFITAWMKWICAQFPGRGPSTTFVGSCRPGIRCLVNWVCYDTDDLSAQLPEYSVGLLIPFGANSVVYKFGTDSGTVYFNSN